MPNYKRYYLENRYVFITVVTYNRKPILVENINLLRECFKKTLKTFDFEIFAAVILPNHFHLIIKPQNIKEFSKIIGLIKKYFSHAINEEYNDKNISESRMKRGEKGIWQRRFHEHLIRDEKDLFTRLDYIHYNPVKHGYTQNVKDWEHSSFHKFVKLKNYDINWGSETDIKNIKDLDYE